MSSMLVASLLSVVEDSQHAEATSLIHASTPRASTENRQSTERAAWATRLFTIADLPAFGSPPIRMFR